MHVLYGRTKAATPSTQACRVQNRVLTPLNRPLPLAVVEGQSGRQVRPALVAHACRTIHSS